VGTEPDKEFWEVWGEERAGERAGERPQGLAPSPAATAPDVTSVAPVSEPAPSLDAGAPDEIVPEGGARLYLNLGRKDGAGVDQIRGLLLDFAAISDVPTIDVMNTHTYLNVGSADADRICAALTGKQLGGRDLVCERARPRRR
jgi:hypothetical protein